MIQRRALEAIEGFNQKAAMIIQQKTKRKDSGRELEPNFRKKGSIGWGYWSRGGVDLGAGKEVQA